MVTFYGSLNGYTFLTYPVAFISNGHNTFNVELSSIYSNDSSVIHPFNANFQKRYLIRGTNTNNSRGLWDNKWGMTNEYNYSYLKPQKIKINLEKTEKYSTIYMLIGILAIPM